MQIQGTLKVQISHGFVQWHCSTKKKFQNKQEVLTKNNLCKLIYSL